MWGNRDNGKSSGWLTRLRRDSRGNALAMMAAFIIPVAALGGSAIDMARLYVVKVRLQQACDAGVLAGRKFMTGDAGALDTNAATQARTFFDNNFKAGWMLTQSISFAPARTAENQVSGTASADVPMTIMRMFGSPQRTLSVACEARYDVADADIMMVLDTTGSMGCPATGACSGGTNAKLYTRADGTTYFATPESPNSKISGLRDAVLDFFDTVKDSADPSTHIRYGFVPYSATTNVGRAIMALSKNYFVTQHSYPSRQLWGEENSGGNSTVQLTGYTSATCAGANGRYPAGKPTARDGWTTSGGAYYITAAAWNASSGKCQGKQQNVVPVWRYVDLPFDVSDYLDGKDDIVDPTRLSGVTLPKWTGCIEERPTRAATSFSLDDLPADLDPDLMPTDDDSKWRPGIPYLVYNRNTPGEVVSKSTIGDVTTTTSQQGHAMPCGKAAKRLSVMTREEIEDYLSAAQGFFPVGNTYHDLGITWGTRFLSPKGPFRNDTKAWANREEPNRHIVFMTDGDMATNTDAYTQYSIEDVEQRISGGSASDDTNRHNTRFVTECNAAKARNITVWVVAFGSTLNTQLKSCATAPWAQHAFFASNDEQLKTAFRSIAQQVAMLRVSK